jgi:hypothetical protein
MSIPAKPLPIATPDAPLNRLAADVRAIVARQRATQILHDAAEVTHSESDWIAYALDEWFVGHPDVQLSTDADYPGWTPGGTR